MNEQKVLEKAKSYLAAYKKWRESMDDKKLFDELEDAEHELLEAIIEEEKEN